LHAIKEPDDPYTLDEPLATRLLDFCGQEPLAPYGKIAFWVGSPDAKPRDAQRLADNSKRQPRLTAAARTLIQHVRSAVAHKTLKGQTYRHRPAV
jgi:hypothetical protein